MVSVEVFSIDVSFIALIHVEIYLQQEKNKVRRPVPSLLPYTLIRPMVLNNASANIPSAPHLFSRAELSTALTEILTRTTKTYGNKSPTFRLKVSDSFPMDVHDTPNTNLVSEDNDPNPVLKFECDDSFGKLYYSSDSD